MSYLREYNVTSLTVKREVFQVVAENFNAAVQKALHEDHTFRTKESSTCSKIIVSYGMTTDTTSCGNLPEELFAEKFEPLETSTGEYIAIVVAVTKERFSLFATNSVDAYNQAQNCDTTHFAKESHTCTKVILKSSTDVVVHTYGKLPEELRAFH